YIDVPRPVIGPGSYIQVVSSRGARLRTLDETGSLPVTGDVLAVARGEHDAFISDAAVADTQVRVLTVPARDPLGRRYALQVARPLSEVHDTLGRITLYLVVIAVGGVALAAALGLLVSRAALAPV